MNQKELQQEQTKMIAEIQANGHNVVTCGFCGAVALHRNTVDEIQCPHCMEVMNLADCSDLFYTSWENEA